MSNSIAVYGICAMLCCSAFLMRWLSAGGSLAAFLMALVFASAGIEAFILPVVLLLGGTLLTKLNRDPGGKKGRNAMQVLANGAVGSMCLLLFIMVEGRYYEHRLFMAYLISFTISISDTFSSETGKYFKARTIDIVNFKPVIPGLSGGVSLPGTMGGLAGAAIGALVSNSVFHVVPLAALLIGGLGFAGMLLDSVLGSVCQAKYRDGSGMITEQPVAGQLTFKGYAWCTNDVVNLLSNVIIVLLFLLL